MKFLKNFTLIGLLLTSCIPTETRPAALSVPLMVFVATSTVVGASFMLTALTYIPYLFLSRHDAAQNFVKYQDDITSYSIAIESKNKNERLFIEAFTASDYKKVIADTLTYLKTKQFLDTQPSPTENKRSRTISSDNEKLVLTPCITLADDETTHTLRNVTIVIRKNKDSLFNDKKLEKALTNRFRIPRIKTYFSPLRHIVLGMTFIVSSSLLGYFSLIPAAIIGIPLLFKQYSSAQAFVDRQEDIASYAVTVKIKRHVKTIKEQTFVGTDYQNVMNDALLYAHQEQTPGLRTVFKPSITLVDDAQVYPLHTIVKKTVPKKPTDVARYWRRLAQSLSDRFIIPEDDSATITNLDRVAYFGLESGAWMLSPYIAVLPFLL